MMKSRSARITRWPQGSKCFLAEKLSWKVARLADQSSRMRRSLVFAFLLNLASLAAAQDSIRWKNPYSRTSAAPPAKRTNLLRSHLAIEFAAPPSAGDLAALAERGAVVQRVLSDRAFIVSAPDFFSTLGLNVTWTGRFAAGEKISAEAGRHAP